MVLMLGGQAVIANRKNCNYAARRATNKQDEF